MTYNTDIESLHAWSLLSDFPVLFRDQYGLAVYWRGHHLPYDVAFAFANTRWANLYLTPSMTESLRERHNLGRHELHRMITDWTQSMSDCGIANHTFTAKEIVRWFDPRGANDIRQ